MTRRRDGLPPMLLGRAAALGEPGERWLDGLDAAIARLEARWGVRVGPPLAGGSHAFAAPAEDEHGKRCVLKIELPDGDPAAFRQGVNALRLAAGRGYAALFAVEEAERAVLLERLGPPLRLLGWPVARQIECLCAVLRETWALPTDGADLPDGAGAVAWFRGYIPKAWEALGRPCPARLISQARDLLDEREARLEAAPRALVHGDAHNNNLLQTPDGAGFKLIDPDGLLYEPAYDLGVLMREWPEQYRADPRAAGQARCRLLARLTGADVPAIWTWGRLQCLSTGLVLLQIGQKEAGRALLALAEAWAEQSGG